MKEWAATLPLDRAWRIPYDLFRLIKRRFKLAQAFTVEEAVRRLVREEIGRLLSPLKQRLETLEGGALSGRGAERRDRRVEVLREVALRGGRVTREEWHQIGRRSGYDPRGLGGLFWGQPPQVRLDGGNVVLTERGYRRLEESSVSVPLGGQGLALRPLRRWDGRPLSEYVIRDRQ